MQPSSRDGAAAAGDGGGRGGAGRVRYTRGGSQVWRVREMEADVVVLAALDTHGEAVRSGGCF